MKGVPRMNAANFEEKARDVHGTKYDYSKVLYTAALSKVTMICPEHGDFQQTPSKHVNAKHGCPKCGGTNKMTLAEFIKKAKEIHGSMSTHYDYSKITNLSGNKTKVEIVCKLHGSFHMAPLKHLHSKQGCRKCKSKFSLPAIAWLEHVAETREIEIKHALRGGEERLELDGTVYFVDGFCAETNTVFQYHGDFYHGCPDLYPPDELNKKVGKCFGELYQETRRVEGLIRSRGYGLETIWEHDWMALCKERGMDPRRPCENPDYACPTAAERKVANRERDYHKFRQRLECEPGFKAHIAAMRKEYDERNKEKLHSYRKEYYAQNKDKILKTQADYLVKNKEKVYNVVAAYRARNKDKRREYDAARRVKDADKLREYGFAYRAKNKDRIREVNAAAYRARKKDKLQAEVADSFQAADTS